MKRFKLKVGIDCDDVIFECIPYAIALANKEYNFDPPLSINEIEGWGYTGKRTDIIFEYFNKAEFYETQPLMKGAKEFIKKLSEMVEVFIITAVYPEFMSIRARRIMEEFLEIPKENILMGSRKDLVNVDILFDDAAHNILSSIAPYPVLFRQPWNKRITGILAVNIYDEFLQLIKVIISNYMEPIVIPNEPNVIALVGPSGSGKTELVTELTKLGAFVKPITSTSRPKDTNESENAYHFKSAVQFQKEKDDGLFFETTMYAGYGYGTKKEDIDEVLKSGKHAIIPIDMCGAIAVKLNFKPCITIFVKKDKEKLLEDVLSRDCSNEDKINRIVSIDAELRNEELCDFTVDNNGTTSHTVEQIVKIIGGSVCPQNSTQLKSA